MQKSVGKVAQPHPITELCMFWAIVFIGSSPPLPFEFYKGKLEHITPEKR